MNELEIKHALIERKTDISNVEDAAKSYAETIIHAPELPDDVTAVMREEVYKKLTESLGGCSLAVVQTEYLFPLPNGNLISENPVQASSSTVVIDTSADIAIRTMPFRPNIMSDVIEWTGVGFVARLADTFDIPRGLKQIHEDFDLAPAVAIPLHDNVTILSKILNSAP